MSRQQQPFPMVLIETATASGVNPFFPLLFGRHKGDVSAMDWAVYRSRSISLTVLNFLVVAQSLSQFVFSWPPDLLSVFSVAVVLLVVFRVFATPTIRIARSNVVAVSVAPWRAWLEHMSHFVALFVASLNVCLTTTGSMQVAAAMIAAGSVSIMFLPVCNALWQCRYPVLGRVVEPK